MIARERRRSLRCFVAGTLSYLMYDRKWIKKPREARNRSETVVENCPNNRQDYFKGTSEGIICLVNLGATAFDWC